jgi:hypothetical protein
VVATLRDYDIARELLKDLLSQGIGATVSKETRETLAAVQELTADLIYVTMILLMLRRPAKGAT